MAPISYSGYRFPRDVIQRAVWMYVRFTLSLRDVEDLLAERGIVVSYETIRRWVASFGPAIARRLRAGRPAPHPRWHLDEMFVRIGGRQMYLWRAVDAEGEVLDVLVQAKRDKAAAAKLMRKLLKKQGMAPSEWVTDKYRVYSSVLRDLGTARRGPSDGKAPQQPSRKFTRPSPATRAKDAKIQVARLGATVPLDARRNLQHLHRSSSPHQRSDPPALPSRGIRYLARGRKRSCLKMGDPDLARPEQTT